MARKYPKWNNKNRWRNYHTATNASIRAATSLDNTKANGTYGGKSKGIGGGWGGMDALTAVQNICEAHSVDVAGYVADYYGEDELQAMAVQYAGHPL